jgi:hypothetical protein
MHALLQQAAQGGDESLTFGEILSGIPHDGPAFFIYLLTAVAVGWVVWASRKRPKGPGAQA